MITHIAFYSRDGLHRDDGGSPGEGGLRGAVTVSRQQSAEHHPAVR